MRKTKNKISSITIAQAIEHYGHHLKNSLYVGNPPFYLDKWGR